jgi:hypothetical protein
MENNLYLCHRKEIKTMAGYRRKHIPIITEVKNWFHDRKMKREYRFCAKIKALHHGTMPFCAAGVWIDDNNNLYNVYGQRIGKFTSCSEETETKKDQPDQPEET